MFRCFLRPRGRPSTSPAWRPFPTISGRRGIKLSQLNGITKSPGAYATVMTGREWLDHLAKNGIGNHSETQKIQQIKSRIVVKVASRHIRKFADDAYFTGASGNCAAEAVVRRYLRDHKEVPLWCIKTVVSSDKPIVRVTARYRLHAAFHQALKNAGYNKAGKRVRKSKIGGGNPTISELFGTVHILAYEPKDILKIPFTTLQDFFNQTVKTVEQRLGRTEAPGKKVQAQRPEKPAQPIPIKRTKVQDRQPKDQAQPISVRRYDSSSPGSRGPQTLRPEPPRGPGDGSRHHWKSGASRSQSNRQTQARNNKPINTGF